ncbi:hypothetical protein NIES4071_93130 [Calothrix sp. NIES-4071]|nr:hypothetical protein NIES4071_93130 [Calothrix sp. NIES-4071]BAZ63580.1 hypothetical protein NIES4105_93060 [Calothrix sp. NIES-4105]
MSLKNHARHKEHKEREEREERETYVYMVAYQGGLGGFFYFKHYCTGETPVPQ